MFARDQLDMFGYVHQQGNMGAVGSGSILLHVLDCSRVALVFVHATASEKPLQGKKATDICRGTSKHILQVVFQTTLRSCTLKGHNNQHALATNPLELFQSEARSPPPPPTHSFSRHFQKSLPDPRGTDTKPQTRSLVSPPPETRRLDLTDRHGVTLLGGWAPIETLSQPASLSEPASHCLVLLLPASKSDEHILV